MKRKLFIVSLIAIFFVCIFSLTAPTIKAEELTDEEWWLLTQMEYYGVGFEKVKYGDKFYYMVYHS